MSQGLGFAAFNFFSETAQWKLQLDIDPVLAFCAVIFLERIVVQLTGKYNTLPIEVGRIFSLLSISFIHPQRMFIRGHCFFQLKSKPKTVKIYVEFESAGGGPTAFNSISWNPAMKLQLSIFHCEQEKLARYPPLKFFTYANAFFQNHGWFRWSFPIEKSGKFPLRGEQTCQTS